MISVTSTFLEEIPGEAYLQKHLQTPIKFVLGQKVVKQGRLLIFKRAHYYLHITLMTAKNVKESFEIPIPYKVEEYPHEGLAYFDYRIQGLCGLNEEINSKLAKVKIKNINPSQYHNKILEIQAQIV